MRANQMDLFRTLSWKKIVFRHPLARACASLLICCLVIGSISSCGGGGGALNGPPPLGGTVKLNGDNVEPNHVTTTAQGTASIDISSSRTSVTITLTTQNVSDVTSVDILASQPKVTSVVLFSLFPASTGPFPTLQKKTITAANFQKQPQFGLNNFDDFIKALTGRAPGSNTRVFIRVSTQKNPTGLIEGTFSNCCGQG